MKRSLEALDCVLADVHARVERTLIPPKGPSHRSPGGGATPQKIGWGCVARSPKPLPYL